MRPAWLLALPLLAMGSAASAQSLNDIVTAACANHHPVYLTGHNEFSQPLTVSCDWLILDLGGGSIYYNGPPIDSVVDMRPAQGEVWRTHVRVQNGTIKSNGNANFALRTHGVSHSIFENLALRDVKTAGGLVELGVANSYRMITCSSHGNPFVTIPQSCFLSNTDGSPGGFGLWASHLDIVIAEGLLGVGIGLSGPSSWNVITGGTSEDNNCGILLSGNGNIATNLDLEANRACNVQIYGDQNQLLGFPWHQ